MTFTEFLAVYSSLKNKPLGGLTTQFELAPSIRLPFTPDIIASKKPRKAAVLALLYPKNKETHILLTQRATYKGTHSNQISFPGGKWDVVDRSLEETALRETFEEVGIPSSEITVFKELTQSYIPPSNFLVNPYLAYMDHTPHFILNHEVETILEIPVKELLKKEHITTFKINTSYAKNLEVPCFKFQDNIVWGATAMILNEIKELLNS